GGVAVGDEQPQQEGDAHGGQLRGPVASQAPQHRLQCRPGSTHAAYASFSVLITLAGAMSLVSTPSRAMLTVPRSSLTTTTIASLTSLRPNAARCRVPCFTDQPSCWSDKGRITPAWVTMSSLMSTAPSCSGPFEAKIVWSKAAVIGAPMGVPVSAYSLRGEIGRAH